MRQVRKPLHGPRPGGALKPPPPYQICHHKPFSPTWLKGDRGLSSGEHFKHAHCAEDTEMLEVDVAKRELVCVY